MPISRKEFERGEPQPSFLVEELLRSNPDCAYTVEELIVGLASKRMALTAEEVQTILNSLEAQGRVESKIIHGVLYYIHSRSVGFTVS